MQGSADTEWDVDKYKSDHEPKHHWELRRKFMEANKGRYSEARLVCLGQVFANVEFMGCRYPKETMDLVEDMAYGIVQEYRESQKDRLKRTFVSGSDAASGKVNRKGPIVQRNKEEGQFSRGAKMPKIPSVKDEFILVRLDYDKDENPCNILTRSASFCKISVSWEVQISKGLHVCQVKLQNTTVLHSASAPTKNEARDIATREALEMLSKSCYTILIKSKYLSADGTMIDANEVGAKEKGVKTFEPENVPSSNIGHKLLLMMGWKGGGLGKGGAGISEPISATQIMNREGFGSKSASREFKQKIRNIIEEYAASSNPFDLVFTSGFDNDQRKEMHMIAKRLGLRSKSFGKNEGRFITISRKFNAQQLIDELVQRGGSTEKYELHPPINHMSN